MEVYRGNHYHVGKHKLNGTIYFCVASNMGPGVIYISRNLDDAINYLKNKEENEDE